MVLDILTTVFLIVVSFTLGAMGANASVSKDKSEAYTKGYKEGYKNAMSYMLTSILLSTSAKNSDS